jgi:hypothetical protein
MGGHPGVINVRIDFPYLKEDTDRHGNVRVYVRRNGCKIRIRAPKGSPEFARAYAEAVHALDHPGAARHRTRTGGHAGMAGGLLFRINPLQEAGPEVADDAPACH